MNWFTVTMILSLVATTLILVLRHFGARLNPFMLMSIVSAIGAVCFFGYCELAGVALHLDKHTLILALLAGLFVCMLDIFFIFMFRFGAPVSLSMPIYRVISIMITASVGLSFFKETLSSVKLIGLMMACGAVYLLNCKTKGEEHV